MSEHEALLEFAEAVETEIGGIWIEEVDDTVLVSLLGWANIQAVAEAYIQACKALNRDIVATYAGESDPMPPEEAARVVDLPRMS